MVLSTPKQRSAVGVLAAALAAASGASAVEVGERGLYRFHAHSTEEHAHSEFLVELEAKAAKAKAPADAAPIGGAAAAAAPGVVDRFEAVPTAEKNEKDQKENEKDQFVAVPAAEFRLEAPHEFVKAFSKFKRFEVSFAGATNTPTSVTWQLTANAAVHTSALGLVPMPVRSLGDSAKLASRADVNAAYAKKWPEAEGAVPRQLTYKKVRALVADGQLTVPLVARDPAQADKLAFVRSDFSAIFGPTGEPVPVLDAVVLSFDSKGLHTGWYYYLGGLLGVGLVLAFLTMPATSSDEGDAKAPTEGENAEAGNAASEYSREGERATKAEWTSVSRMYLMGWYLAGMVDWLNGPAIFEVIFVTHDKGENYSMIMGSGFLAGAVLGPLVGLTGDKFGNKRMCQLYCFLYMFNYVLNHVHAVAALVFGQILNGAATRIFYASFESWYVSTHLKKGWSGERLGQTLSWMFFGNSLVAIAAGLVSWGLKSGLYDGAPGKSVGSYFGVEWYFGGPLAGNVLASGFAVVALVVITFGWPALEEKEQRGEAGEKEALTGGAAEEEDGSAKAGGVMECVRLLRADPKIPVVLGAMALFEGQMMLFVVTLWPLLMELTNIMDVPITSRQFNFEIAFTILLSGYLVGSCCFNFLRKLASLRQLAWMVMSFGAAGVAISAFVFQGHLADMEETVHAGSTCLGITWQMVALTGLVMFEFCIGVYFPTMGSIKAEVVPDHVRTTMYNLFYVPMNVSLAALTILIPRGENELGARIKFFVCVAGVALAAVLMVLYARLAAKEEAEASEESSEASDAEGEAEPPIKVVGQPAAAAGA